MYTYIYIYIYNFPPCVQPLCKPLTGLWQQSYHTMQSELGFAHLLDCCVVEATRSVAEDHISFRQLCWLLGLFQQLSEHWQINSETGSM